MQGTNSSVFLNVFLEFLKKLKKLPEYRPALVIFTQFELYFN